VLESLRGWTVRCPVLTYSSTCGALKVRYRVLGRIISIWDGRGGRTAHSLRNAIFGRQITHGAVSTQLFGVESQNSWKLKGECDRDENGSKEINKNKKIPDSQKRTSGKEARVRLQTILERQRSARGH